MWNILIFFALGVGLGWLVRKRPKLIRVNGWVTNLLLGGLIFMLGLSAGGQPEVVSNFSRLGLTSIVLTVGAIAGSILAVLPIAHKYKRETD